MSARDEWYRSRSWDEAARTAFDTKIRRSRAGYTRAQYFWLKAGALFYARPAQRELRLAAIELLQRALVESQATGHHRGQLLDDLGRYQLIMGQREEGVASLRESLALGTVGIKAPRTEVLLARCLVEDGDRAGAIALYDAVCKSDAKDGKPSYAELAAREFVDAIGNRYADPEEAAEAVVVYFHALDEIDGGVPEIFAADLGSLAALDRVFRIERDLVRPRAPLHYRRDFNEQHVVPELGAYVGRVLCKIAGGTWRAAPRLMQSRVMIGKRNLDPFRVAYDAAYYELPLEPAVRELLG